MTVPAGDAEHWVGVAELRLAPPGRPSRAYAVEHARAYADRLVLKLEGIDDGTVAAALKGFDVRVDREHAPPLPVGEHYRAGLLGMTVRLTDGTTVGVVRDVRPTGAADLLVVAPEGHDPSQDTDEEILIPFHRALVPSVDEERGEIRIAPPPGLLELNRGGDDRGGESSS